MATIRGGIRMAVFKMRLILSEEASWLPVSKSKIYERWHAKMRAFVAVS